MFNACSTAFTVDLNSELRPHASHAQLVRMKGFENGYTPGSFLWIINSINFQYFSILILLLSAVVMVDVSLATSTPDYERIQGLTYGTATREDKARTRLSWGGTEVLASAFVLVCILFAYLYFRG